jgi:selenoprotein W-related protein
LEEHLKAKYNGADIKLISSGGGVFEITLENKLIFSKKSLGRFPDDGEIDSLIDQNIV